MTKVIDQLKKIFLFTICLFTLGFLFLSHAKTASADYYEQENYGWMRIVKNPDTSQNTVIVNYFDAHTGAPLNLDYARVDVGHWAGTVYKTYECTSFPCQSTVTLSSFPNDNQMGIGVWYAKAGYLPTYVGNGNGNKGYLEFTGGTSYTFNVYVTLTTDPYQTRISMPYKGGNWVNYIPDNPTLSVNPSFDTGASTVSIQSYSSFAGWADSTSLTPAPFPLTKVIPWPSSLPDGFSYNMNYMLDNTNAFSGYTIVGFYKDTVPPTINDCTATISGNQINIHLFLTDQSGAPGAPGEYQHDGAGVASGALLEVSTDGGSNWSVAANLSDQGWNIDKTVSYPAAPNTTYQFRFRAKDRAFDNTGNPNNTQYSSYCFSSPLTTPPPPPIPPVSPLIINGGVFVGSGGTINFHRHINNSSTTPAERINYNLKALYVLPNIVPQLSTTNTYFTEVNP